MSSEEPREGEVRGAGAACMYPAQTFFEHCVQTTFAPVSISVSKTDVLGTSADGGLIVKKALTPGTIVPVARPSQWVGLGSVVDASKTLCAQKAKGSSMEPRFACAEVPFGTGSPKKGTRIPCNSVRGPSKMGASASARVAANFACGPLPFGNATCMLAEDLERLLREGGAAEDAVAAVRRALPEDEGPIIPYTPSGSETQPAPLANNVRRISPEELKHQLRSNIPLRADVVENYAYICIDGWMRNARVTGTEPVLWDAIRMASTWTDLYEKMAVFNGKYAPIPIGNNVQVSCPSSEEIGGTEWEEWNFPLTPPVQVTRHALCIVFHKGVRAGERVSLVPQACQITENTPTLWKDEAVRSVFFGMRDAMLRGKAGSPYATVHARLLERLGGEGSVRQGSDVHLRWMLLERFSRDAQGLMRTPEVWVVGATLKEWMAGWPHMIQDFPIPPNQSKLKLEQQKPAVRDLFTPQHRVNHSELALRVVTVRASVEETDKSAMYIFCKTEHGDVVLRPAEKSMEKPFPRIRIGLDQFLLHIVRKLPQDTWFHPCTEEEMPVDSVGEVGAMELGGGMEVDPLDKQAAQQRIMVTITAAWKVCRRLASMRGRPKDSVPPARAPSRMPFAISAQRSMSMLEAALPVQTSASLAPAQAASQTSAIGTVTVSNTVMTGTTVIGAGAGAAVDIWAGMPGMGGLDDAMTDEQMDQLAMLFDGDLAGGGVSPLAAQPAKTAANMEERQLKDAGRASTPKRTGQLLESPPPFSPNSLGASPWMMPGSPLKLTGLPTVAISSPPRAITHPVATAAASTVPTNTKLPSPPPGTTFV